MTLNPNHNLFSVAPVGHIIVIGRAGSLKGGLERDRAMNLLGWLVIATGATPSEIRDVIKAAHVQPAPVPVAPAGVAVQPRVMAPPPIVRPTPGPGAQPVYAPPKPAPVTPTVAAPIAIGAPLASVPAAGGVVPFMGDVDAEEAAALAEALAKAGEALPDEAKTAPVDTDKLAAAWDAAG